MRTLPRHEVHVWLAASEMAGDAEGLRDYLELLDETERARHLGFVQPEHRHLYLVAHALVRTTLSRYAEVPPGAWTFTCNAYGRPDIVRPPGAPPLRFSLSHTRGLAACAVVLGRDVGVDVERVDPRHAPIDVAEGHFAASEVEALRALPASRQLDRFYDYWTLKESYVKARGLGIGLGLENFSFELRPGTRPVIRFTDAIDDTAGSWQFASFDAADRYRLAVAVRRGRGPDLAVRSFMAVPRGDVREIPVGARD